CMMVCPTYAIERRGDGQVKVIEDKCIGCKMCMMACPFGVMTFNMERHVAMNCDLCGGDPQCAKICPTDALVYGETDNIPWQKSMAFANKALTLVQARE